MSLWLWLIFCRRSPQLDDKGVQGDNPADGHPLVATHPTGDGGGDKPACGQLLWHLTTGFGQPYGVRWTPPGCPLAPSHYDGSLIQPRLNHITQRRDDVRQPPVAESALADIDRP